MTINEILERLEGKATPEAEFQTKLASTQNTNVEEPIVEEPIVKMAQAIDEDEEGLRKLASLCDEIGRVMARSYVDELNNLRGE